MSQKKISNWKRYLIVMILGVILNEACFLTASYFQFPVWMDMTGTVLAAIVLEPAAGLLVGLSNNFFLSLFIYDASSLVYYIVSAAAAIITGVCLKKDGKICAKRIVPVMALVLVSSTLLSGLLTLWHGGVPNAQAELMFYWKMVDGGWNTVAACFLSSGIVKVLDVTLSTILIIIIYKLLPRWLKSDLSGAQKTIEEKTE